MNLPENYTILFKNVKQVRIRVNQGQQVRIVVPLGIPQELLEQILKRRESWIQKHLQRFRMKIPPLHLSENQLLYKGKIFVLELQESWNGLVEIDQEQGTIRSGDRLFHQHHQEVWYRSEAKKYLEQRVKTLAAHYGFHLNRIFIRSQKTRWGSCSRQKNISLNWRLIKAPLSMIDYVILHELAHTECMDHSKKFWQRVQSLYPEYQTAIRWFKEYGSVL